jgi:HEAT repeat protein
MRNRFVLLVALVCGCGGQKNTDYWIAQATKAPSAAERLQAIDALKQRTAEAEVVVPALAESLKDTDTFVRRDAARALGDFGPEARAAVPALLALQKDKEPVRRAVEEALGRIDPEAANRFKPSKPSKPRR